MGKIKITYTYDQYEEAEATKELQSHKDAFCFIEDLKQYLRENRRHKEVPDSFEVLDDKITELLIAWGL